MDHTPPTRRTALSPQSISSYLDQHPAWTTKNNQLHRQIEFTSYMNGIEFVNRVAELAEEANHHPDILVLWQKVDISLTTHDAGGITQVDLDFADRLESILLAYSH